MGNNPSYFKKCGDDCPVEQVSWNDCQEFIRKLNQREGANRYRLPTEAEWEYVSRAGSNTAFANGGITETGCGHDPNLDAMGWYCGNSDSKTHPFGQKQPNAWGLYDMHGNVCEWCEDWHGLYSSSHVTDPIGRSSGTSRVLRGGSWKFSARSIRSASRAKNFPHFGLNFYGFRVVRTLHEYSATSHLSSEDLEFLRVLMDKGFVPKDADLKYVTSERLQHFHSVLKELGIEDIRSWEPPSSKEPDPSFSTPEKTWEIYKRSLEEGDLESTMRCLAPSFQKEHREMLEHLGKERVEQLAKNMRHIDRVHGDDEVAQYRITKKEIIQGKPYDITDHIWFRNMFGEWKILEF
jgi:hypothetical protein